MNELNMCHLIGIAVLCQWYVGYSFERGKQDQQEPIPDQRTSS